MKTISEEIEAAVMAEHDCTFDEVLTALRSAKN